MEKAKLTPELEQHLKAEGFLMLKEINGIIIGIYRYMFTIAIVVDIDKDGYQHRYCYPYEHTRECLMAYHIYEGEGDPIGPWIKNKGWNRDRLNPAIEDKHIK
jgi:hypothetical protein